MAGASVDAVCAEVLRALHEVALFDWAVVLTTDPETLLPSGGIVEGFGAETCALFWDNELLDPDFNKFTQLARSHDPVATLVQAVDGDLARSPRYTKLYAPMGAADELRLALVAGHSCLAIATLVRPGEAGAFTPAEVRDVGLLVPVATRVLRRAFGRMSQAAGGEPPMMIVLDEHEQISVATPGARQILDELRTEHEEGALPAIVRAAAVKARWSRASMNLTTRIRGGNGRWLRLYIAPVEGQAGAVALLIETDRADDLMRILLESYGLTHRETEVVRLLARGLAPKDIAAELLLSVHTVRDHVKAIYEKVGVSSRGELVAVLFARHVIDRLHQAVTQAS